MLAPVQPDRVQFVQRRADGRSANAFFRQINADPSDHIGTRVAAVDLAAHVHHHTVGIGQDGEITRFGDGVAKLFERRACGLQQRVIGLFRAAHGLLRHHVETHCLVRAQSVFEAALPGLRDPGRRQLANGGLAVMQQGLPCILDVAQTLFGAVDQSLEH